MNWETVIGLEIHAQLKTESKIFSTSPTAYGAEPNTQANEVDLALPGVLPVLNKKALEYAVRFGLAIDAEIHHFSAFDRKNYFYPDLPKGYQTSQLFHPTVGKGHIDIELENGETKRIGITRAHLEEDAGKSVHDAYQGMSGIDLNRAGTPLIEIVSEPDLRSPAEAVAYLRKIYAIVRYLDINDGNLQEGSFRCDINVSIRPQGQEAFGTRTEIKNVNSFRFVEKAAEYEIERQIDVLESGGKITQETRLYDSDKNVTRSMRSKEEANDYRYFPCPDLLPIIIDDDYIESIRAQLPELPDQRKMRFVEALGLSTYDADILTSERELADFFEDVVKAADGETKLSANWVITEVLGLLNKEDKSIADSPVTTQQLGSMIKRIKDNTISSKIAKQVFNAMLDSEDNADTIIEREGLKQVTDSGAIEALVDEVIANNPQQVENYRNADESKRPKMLGFFVGQIMKASKGKANPQQVNELLLKKL